MARVSAMAKPDPNEVPNMLNREMIEYLLPADGIATAYDQLTPTERLFVQAYLVDADPRGAAIRSIREANGHVITARQADPRAAELMRRPLVRAAIADKLREVAARSSMSADEVVAELAKIGRATMADFVKITDMGEPYVDLSNVTPENLAAIGEVTVEDYTEGRGPNARNVRKVKFKLHDKLNALDKLMRHYGLYEKDNKLTVIDGRTDGQITPDMTPEQAADLYQESLRIASDD